ncbi:phospholipid carrier-dependent glycosyltransferase, partial [bacterium]|nr:phospholipid carrier-dependent glycosyltransferase [bacterium]
MLANSVNHSDSQPWRLSICLGLLVLVWAGLYLPRLGTEQLRFEEGRRALAAREMMESQSYFYQTVLGRAYLNKPPTFTWFIVGTSTIFGGMSEFSIRFPSVLATFLTALLVFFFDRGSLPRQSRLLAALIFLMTLMTVEKGALGEIEALLTLCIWLSVWAWWHGYQSNRLVWWILSGFGLGSAIALKGPAALVFFYGTVIPFCWIQGRRRWLISIPHGLIVGLAVLLNGGWILPLFFLADADTILATWEGQILREGIRYNFLDWISNQGEFIFTALVSFLPGSVLF